MRVFACALDWRSNYGKIIEASVNCKKCSFFEEGEGGCRRHSSLSWRSWWGWRKRGRRCDEESGELEEAVEQLVNNLDFTSFIKPNFFFPNARFQIDGPQKSICWYSFSGGIRITWEKYSDMKNFLGSTFFKSLHVWELLGSQHERAKPVPFCCWLIVTQVWHCKMRSSKLGRYQKTTCHQISVSIHSCLRGATGSCIYLGYEVLPRQTMLSQLCAKQIENVKSCRHLLQVPK